MNYLWFTELFKVLKILDTKPLTYRLRDIKEIKRRRSSFAVFMTSNFTKSKIRVKSYQIEQILKSRIQWGKRQLLVCWLGYNSDFDSWVAVEDIYIL